MYQSSLHALALESGLTTFPGSYRFDGGLPDDALDYEETGHTSGDPDRAAWHNHHLYID